MRKIVPSRLTTSGLTRNGEAVRLDFLNQDGDSESLELSIEQAQSVVMTLPMLLSRAVKESTGDPQARFVFSMGDWSLESTYDAECLLVTLKTSDGFEATFGMSFIQCRQLGSALQRQGSDQGPAEPVDACAVPTARLN